MDDFIYYLDGYLAGNVELNTRQVEFLKDKVHNLLYPEPSGVKIGNSFPPNSGKFVNENVFGGFPKLKAYYDTGKGFEELGTVTEIKETDGKVTLNGSAVQTVGYMRVIERSLKPFRDPNQVEIKHYQYSC